ncbi:hypothetical protein CVD19_12025 [Bacillus sp. T33-2]|nr:hypothetical protein CVD19_12025 [Bacillus sp. T33-2]
MLHALPQKKTGYIKKACTSLRAESVNPHETLDPVKEWEEVHELDETLKDCPNDHLVDRLPATLTVAAPEKAIPRLRALSIVQVCTVEALQFGI